MDNKIQIFEDKRIRTVWNEETEEWYFSVVDVVSVLTDSVDGRKYWNKLKQRLKEEGNESYWWQNAFNWCGWYRATFENYSVNTITKSRAI